MCTSQEAFENDSYNGIALEDNLENKVKAKKREAFYMGVFEHSAVNKKGRFLLICKITKKTIKTNTERKHNIHH
jgi:hypothetical protein